MKRPGFFHGVIAAAILGFGASACIALFTPLLGIGALTRLLIPGLALAYMLYLFSCNSEKTGRITTLALWSALTLVTWWAAPPLPLYLLIHAGAIWLVRSLYFYSGVLPSLMDMGLTGLGILTSVWALSRTGSIFLGVWCFFLLQALFVAVPQSMHKKAEPPVAAINDQFERARRQAEAAFRQLITK